MVQHRHATCRKLQGSTASHKLDCSVQVQYDKLYRANVMAGKQLTSSNRILRSHTACFLCFCPAEKLSSSEFPNHKKSARAATSDNARITETSPLANFSTGCSAMTCSASCLTSKYACMHVCMYACMHVCTAPLAQALPTAGKCMLAFIQLICMHRHSTQNSSVMQVQHSKEFSKLIPQPLGNRDIFAF